MMAKKYSVQVIKYAKVLGDQWRTNVFEKAFYTLLGARLFIKRNQNKYAGFEIMAL